MSLPRGSFDTRCSISPCRKGRNGQSVSLPRCWKMLALAKEQARSLSLSERGLQTRWSSTTSAAAIVATEATCRPWLPSLPVRALRMLGGGTCVVVSVLVCGSMTLGVDQLAPTLLCACAVCDASVRRLRLVVVPMMPSNSAISYEVCSSCTLRSCLCHSCIRLVAFADEARPSHR